VPVQKVPKGALLEEDLIILAIFGLEHLIEIETELEGDPTFLQEYLRTWTILKCHRRQDAKSSKSGPFPQLAL
jgi:hypothetical protein